MSNLRNTGAKIERKTPTHAPHHPDEEYAGETLEKHMVVALTCAATGMLAALVAAVSIGYYTLPANVAGTCTITATVTANPGDEQTTRTVDNAHDNLYATTRAPSTPTASPPHL